MTRRMPVWVPAVLWALFLFLLSEMRPTPRLGGSLPGFTDKLAHFALYLVFGVLLARIGATHASKVAHSLLLAAGALYGIADEWHQGFVPGRDPDPADWVADLAGLAVGYLTIMLVSSRKAQGPRDMDGE